MGATTVSDSGPKFHPGWLSVFLQLMKLRVIVLLQITAVCAILVHDLLSRHGLLEIERTWADTGFTIIITIIGGTLSAGGSNSINMWYDSDIDMLMTRTQKRPIPQGHISPVGALIFGIIISLSGSSIFFLLHWKAAFWSFFSVAFYVLIYSMWLKRRTPQNIVIGGIAGATPPLIGWAGAAGDSLSNLNPFDLGSAIPWMLFALIFLWTPPHFWALAVYKYEDYKKADIPMLPVTHGKDFARLHIFLYSILLFCLRITRIRNIPGRAIKSPVCVVISASEIPAATMSTVSEPPPEEIAERKRERRQERRKAKRVWSRKGQLWTIAWRVTAYLFVQRRSFWKRFVPRTWRLCRRKGQRSRHQPARSRRADHEVSRVRQ